MNNWSYWATILILLLGAVLAYFGHGLSAIGCFVFSALWAGVSNVDYSRQRDE